MDAGAAGKKGIWEAFLGVLIRIQRLDFGTVAGSDASTILPPLSNWLVGVLFAVLFGITTFVILRLLLVKDESTTLAITSIPVNNKKLGVASNNQANKGVDESDNPSASSSSVADVTNSS